MSTNAAATSETRSISSKGHTRTSSVSSNLRSRLSQIGKRSSKSSANFEEYSAQSTDKQQRPSLRLDSTTESIYRLPASAAEQPQSSTFSHARSSSTISHTRSPSSQAQPLRKNNDETQPASSTQHPSDEGLDLQRTAQDKRAASSLSTHVSHIYAFFIASSALSILATRFVHWSMALVIAATLAYVLRAQLHIAIDDSKWEKEEQKRSENIKNRKYQAETVEWMNNVLKTVWPLINQDYFVPLVDLMEDALMQQVPGIVHSCRVEDLDQGQVPLRVTSFRLLDPQESGFIGDENAQTETDEASENGEAIDVGDFVNLELTFAYRSPAARRKKAKSNKAEGVMTDAEREAENNIITTSDMPVDQIHMLIYMAIGLQKIAAVEVPVWCEVLGIEGKMRLRIQLVPTAPFVGHVAFTFVNKPKIEISAKPLGRRMVIDAMHLPLISTYVLHSVEAVIKDFISPKSYTVDVASLLEVQDGPRNVYALGVIVLVIHQATDLPAADSNGQSDPFVSVSFARAGRPLFTTRVLLRTVNPIWQEVAILPVSPDEVRDRERLRMTVFDADRFSVDDPLGKAEVSIDKLIHRALSSVNSPNAASLFETQTEPLQRMRQGKEAQGNLTYSVGFFRLAKPTDGGRQSSKVNLLRQAAGRHLDEPASSVSQQQEKGLPLPPDTPASAGDTTNADDSYLYEQYTTPFDRFVRSIGLPLDENVLRRRRERSERVKKLTTLMEGEAQATFGPPDKRWPSGIICFHIHSITDLGFEPPQRSWTNSKRLGQKPQYTADEDVLGEGVSKMPNSYVQVLLNDEPVFRSRTKTLNPRPFINAGSERFVRDFNTARIDFVVRDARQRENDAILGIVGLKLDECICETSRVTQWYTLTGGLGYGKIRISLLWRSCELQIPPQLRGWNVGVLEVASCYVGGMSADQKAMFDKREAHLLFETVGGRAETEDAVPHWEEAEGNGKEESSSSTIGFRWDLQQSARIAVRQRYPNFLYVHLRSDSRLPGRSHKHAHTVIPLNSLQDGKETQKRLPLYETSDWQQFEQEILRTWSNEHQLAAGSSEEAKKRKYPTLEEMVGEIDRENELKQGKMRKSIDGASIASSTSSSALLKLVGYLDITIIYHPGLAPEHRSMLGGDHELRVAFECFQALIDCGQRAKPKMLSASRKRKLSLRGGRRASSEDSKTMSNNGAPDAGHAKMSTKDAQSQQRRPSALHIDTDEEVLEGSQYGRQSVESQQEEGEGVRGREGRRLIEFQDAQSTGSADAGEGDEEGLIEADSPEGRRARMRNMHRQQRGAAQIKSFRTLQWLKTNAEDGVGRVKRIASKQQEKRIAKMENEGVSHF